MSLELILDMASDGLGSRIALGRTANGITYQQVADTAASGAAVIATHAPSHVVYLGRNGPIYPQLIFASTLAGVPFVPMNYRLADNLLAELIDEFPNPLLIVEEQYLPRVAGRSPAFSVDDFLAAAAEASPIVPVEVSDDAPAVLLHTSGTTSRPKTVPLRHENLLAYVFSTVEFASADPEGAALVAVPPYHVAAIGSALSSFYSGRRVVYLPDFDPTEWLRLVADEKVTTAMVVPTMLARIVDRLGGAVASAPDLELLAYGGARMPMPVLEKAMRAFPKVGFCNAYGLTETSSTLALLGPDDHREALASDDPAVQARLGSVGRPVPGIEVEIRKSEGGVAAAGETGELLVRGPQVSGEYVGKGSALDADGWFRTGDYAWLDDGGYLFISGRSDDTIIRGGENIGPAEIEDVLLRHPDVNDVAVIGLPDDEWGQRLTAVVVPSTGTSPDQEQLRAYVREILRGSRTPDQIIFTNDLPHTPTGKVLRRELIAQYADVPV